MKTKPRQHRAVSKARIADPSIALGLRYLATYHAFCVADAERDDMEGKVRNKYPQAPAEIIVPNVPNPNALRDEEEIKGRMSEPARSNLLLMLWEEQRKRDEIDRETGYTAKVAEARRLDEMAEALRVLWLAEPATTVCGVALKLRAWLYHGNPWHEDDLGDRVGLAALEDAERLCGVRHMAAFHPRTTFGEFADRTRADFSAVVGPHPAGGAS